MTTELEIWAGLVSSVSLATLATWTSKLVSTVWPIYSFEMVWPLLVGLVIKAS